MEQVPSHLERPIVPALDDMLGEPITVLDDGFIRVMDYMGSDSSIVQAARVSYGKGTKKVHEDRGLIRYLMRHRHTTPFEMCEITFHVRVPMDCWRQWVRHRTANINEYSTRYSIAIDAVQKTRPDAWRLQAKGNRQGSQGVLEKNVGQYLSDREQKLQSFARDVYQERLGKGIAREQARKDLPLSTYTETYWKIDLHNLLHFLELRMSDHAQQEIRSYAKVIGEQIVAIWCPLTWQAFVDYQLCATNIARLEAAIIRAINTEGPEAGANIAASNGLLERGPGGLLRNREREEIAATLTRLGFEIPWEDNMPG